MNSTKVARTRTTIFKLIGPCEILSHGQKGQPLLLEICAPNFLRPKIATIMILFFVGGKFLPTSNPCQKVHFAFPDYIQQRFNHNSSIFESYLKHLELFDSLPL